ncbi:hypothetical protein D3C84_927710 [compost metagenome]
MPNRLPSQMLKPTRTTARKTNGTQPAGLSVQPLSQASSITRAARARPIRLPILPEWTISCFITEDTSCSWCCSTSASLSLRTWICSVLMPLASSSLSSFSSSSRLSLM